MLRLFRINAKNVLNIHVGIYEIGTNYYDFNQTLRNVIEFISRFHLKDESIADIRGH